MYFLVWMDHCLIFCFPPNTWLYSEICTEQTTLFVELLEGASDTIPYVHPG